MYTYIVLYCNVFNNISLYKYIHFIYSFVNPEHIDGEEVLEIVTKFTDSYKVYLQRDGPQRGMGGVRASCICRMKLVWNMYSFCSLSLWPILGWPHPHLGLQWDRIQNFKSPFLAQKFFLSSRFMHLTVYWTSPQRSPSFLKHNRFKTELNSFDLDFLSPSFPSHTLITEFSTFYVSSLLVFTRRLRPQILF